MPEIGCGAVRRTRAITRPRTAAMMLPTTVTSNVTLTKAASMSGNAAQT